MNIVGLARRVRIYAGESDQWQLRPLYLAILEFLRAEGAAGATVMRGIAGFGANSRIHTATILRLSEDLPIVIEWIDAPERVERLLPRVLAMVDEGLVTIEDVQVAKYTHRAVRGDVPGRLRVADVMSHDIVHVRPDTPIGELARLMIQSDRRAVPVVGEDDQVIGIVTNGDLVTRGDLAMRLELLGRAGPAVIEREIAALGESGKTVVDIMTPGVITIRADTPLLEAAQVMADRHLKRLPVVDAHQRLLGVVGRVDLLRTIGQGYPAPEARPERQHQPPRVVREVMRKNVPTAPATATLPEIVDAVISSRLNRAIVVDAEQRVVGIISDAELIRRVGERPGVIAALMRHPGAAVHGQDRASDLMIADVLTTHPDVPIDVAIREMLARQYKILPVVDDENHLLGIVDRFDLLRAIAAPDVSSA